MNAFLPLVPVDKEIYAREYLIPAACFECNEGVTLHAECTHTSERDRDDGYYALDFYFSVGDYCVREHLIGLFFGDRKMTREEIDRTIDDFARSQIDDTFPLLVADYLDRQDLWEEESVNRNLAPPECEEEDSNNSEEDDED